MDKKSIIKVIENLENIKDKLYKDGTYKQMSELEKNILKLRTSIKYYK